MEHRKECLASSGFISVETVDGKCPACITIERIEDLEEYRILPLALKTFESYANAIKEAHESDDINSVDFLTMCKIFDLYAKKIASIVLFSQEAKRINEKFLVSYLSVILEAGLGNAKSDVES